MNNLERLTTLVTQDTGAIRNGQSRETDNIGHTRHRGQSRMDNLERLTTLGTQDTGRRQTKHKNTTQKTKEMSNTDFTKIKPGVNTLAIDTQNVFPDLICMTFATRFSSVSF